MNNNVKIIITVQKVGFFMPSSANWAYEYFNCNVLSVSGDAKKTVIVDTFLLCTTFGGQDKLKELQDITEDIDVIFLPSVGVHVVRRPERKISINIDDTLKRVTEAVRASIIN